MVAACPFPARRGTPLRIERLAEALAGRGHDVEVITYHVADTPQSLPFALERIPLPAKFQRVSPGPSLRKLLLLDPLLWFKTGQRLRQRKFDLIHAHHYEGLLVARWAWGRGRLPIVYDAHTMLASELPTYDLWIGGRLARRLGNFLDRALPRQATHVVTVTEDIRDRLVNTHRFDPTRVSVVPNGVELGHFELRPSHSSSPPEQIVYSGTLAPYQNVDLLLQAFAVALRTRPSLRLVVSASSPFAPYEESAAALGIRSAIELLDDDFDRLPRLLRSAAVAVLPRNRCDGIPQKLLNYMAAGVPVVACAGSAKVLEHERTGLVVPDGDVAGFAAAILRLVEAPEWAGRLGANARNFVKLHHTWARAARLTEQVYAALLPGLASAIPLLP